MATINPVLRAGSTPGFAFFTARLLVMESNVLAVDPLAPLDLFSGMDSTPGFAIIVAFTVFIVRLLVMGASVLAVDLLADLSTILSHFQVFFVVFFISFESASMG